MTISSPRGLWLPAPAMKAAAKAVYLKKMTSSSEFQLSANDRSWWGDVSQWRSGGWHRRWVADGQSEVSAFLVEKWSSAWPMPQFAHVVLAHPRPRALLQATDGSRGGMQVVRFSGLAHGFTYGGKPVGSSKTDRIWNVWNFLKYFLKNLAFIWRFLVKTKFKNLSIEKIMQMSLPHPRTPSHRQHEWFGQSTTKFATGWFTGHRPR
jgi:hypothetical protein